MAGDRRRPPRAARRTRARPTLALALTLTLLAPIALALLGCQPGQIGEELHADAEATRADAASAAADSLAPDGGAHPPGADAGSASDAQGPSPDAHVDNGAPATLCAPIAGASYASLSTAVKSDRPAAVHGDLNLMLRKQRAVGETQGLVDVGGPTDPAQPPQLYSLFGDQRVPAFSAVYQVEAWDWGCNCPKGWITSPPVTLAGMATTPGEILHAPKSSYDIGNGHTALVLYATEHTITIKYTREDNVVSGYTVHIDNICVEPSLLALYRALDAAGRGTLPALDPQQPMGRARGAEIHVAIRDTGAWMDPRVRKDWWQGK
ncbi:MAG: hypothetical protein KC503_08900 [Myxococcales bacterium]|nr:hypothetical protein [Myxococcales bacterium]